MNVSACIYVQIYKHQSLGCCPQFRHFDRVDTLMLPKAILISVSLPPPPITALLLFQVCLPLFRCLSIVTILLAPSICSQKQKSKILIDAALQVGPTLQEIKSWFELAVASGKHSADQMEE